MTYKRMTEADRRQIHRWRQEGDGLRGLARRLGHAARAAENFSATQAARVTVQSRRTSRRKSGLCDRGRVGSRMRFGQLSSCGSKRVGLQRSSVDAPSWRDVQWCARSRSTSISIATPRPAATCGPAFLAPGASAAGAARARQGGGGGRFRTSV